MFQQRKEDYTEGEKDKKVNMQLKKKLEVPIGKIWKKAKDEERENYCTSEFLICPT